MAIETITDNGLSGNRVAKAWVLFDGSGSVPITDSFNVASITDNGVGSYTVNLTNNMASAVYGVNTTINQTITTQWMYAGTLYSAQTAGTFRIECRYNAAQYDYTAIFASVFGDQ